MMNTEHEIIPKLSLIGAGPGDPELITVKALKVLASADVILYDALVNTELLKHTRKEAKRVFVGKRAGSRVYSQSEINNMIINYAYNFGHVARLKGGDSFVFGRGHEELAYAELFNIKVEVIPGISSSYAVPELQHIPLTKRGINESFWVITATTSAGDLSEDIYRAAGTNATIIILMGTQKLKEISEVFIRAGKPEIPAAIIQNGSLPDEKIAVGKVEDLQELASQKKLGSPAVIIIGDVVSLHPKAQAVFKNNLALKLNR